MRAAALSLVLMVCPSLANAQSEQTPLRVEYDAAEACPDRDAFLVAVRERAPHVRPATGAEKSETARVTVRAGAADGPFEGKLIIIDLSGRESVRTLQGESCVDVARGLALVLALHSVEQARSAERPIEIVPQPPAAPARAESLPPERTPRPRWEHGPVASFGLRSAVTHGLGPEVGASYFVGRAGDPGVLTPAFRLGFGYSWGFADSLLLRLYSAQADVSFVRLVDRPAITMTAGARIEFGSHHASVRADGGGSNSGLWLALGLPVSTRLRVGRGVFVALDTAIMFPMVINRFYTDPQTRVFVVKVPPVAAALSTGVGFAFP